MIDKVKPIEELLSRCTDGDMTAEDRDRIDLAVADDTDCAALLNQYKSLDHILAAWRLLPPGVNWAALQHDISASLSQNIASARKPVVHHRPEACATGGSEIGSEADQSVDALLQNWAGPLPEVDWQAYKVRVSAAIQREAGAMAPSHGSLHGLRRTAAWLMPLAAAAVIALAVWGPDGLRFNGSPSGRSGQSMVLVSLDMPVVGGRVAIAFDESPIEATGSEGDVPGGSAFAIGPPHDDLPAIGDNGIAILY